MVKLSLKVLACEIAQREFQFVAAQSPHLVEMEWLPVGYHDRRSGGHRDLQARGDAVPADRGALMRGERPGEHAPPAILEHVRRAIPLLDAPERRRGVGAAGRRARGPGAVVGSATGNNIAGLLAAAVVGAALAGVLAVLAIRARKAHRAA